MTGGIQLQPGVETLTIVGAAPGAALTVSRPGGAPLVTVLADDLGQAHVAFVPATHIVVTSVADWAEALSTGHTLEPGEYVVTEDATGEVHGPARVLAVTDHPDPSLYEQELKEGFGYLEVRDGVTLSIMVRFPNPDLYGPAPWPTVVEYSGYAPSNPDVPQPGSLLANLLGFAVVGVNMRGTGCSGGVFDVFSPAQAADGYDVVETVSRQPWVLRNRVGMVGLSYPGISQLYVASTMPPSLAAITPLSVIDDLWRQQWPGGTYNSGFTRAWLAARDAILEEVMAKGWHPDSRAFVQSYGSDALDASLLLLPLVFFTAPNDPRMLRTIDAIARPVRAGGLAADGLVYRYNPAQAPDGLAGAEGTFNMCSFWLIEAQTRAGRTDPARLADARLRFEQMLGYANHLGLYAEQTGPSGEALGNFPQAFTHLALVEAAMTLAERQPYRTLCRPQP